MSNTLSWRDVNYVVQKEGIHSVIEVPLKVEKERTTGTILNNGKI